MVSGTAEKGINLGRVPTVMRTGVGGIGSSVQTREKAMVMAETKNDSLNVFSFVKEINHGKRDLIAEAPESERIYDPFVVNRSFSYFNDTVMYANEMNKNHHIDPALQNSFFLNTIRKRKRFSKWMKPSELEDLDVVKEYYGYSTEKAREALALLSNSQINELKKRVYKGGYINNNKSRGSGN